MDAKVKIKPKLEVIREPIPHLLVPGEMGAVLELTVKDKIGKVTEHRVMRSKSFVRQFLEVLFAFLNCVPQTSTAVTARDTGNVVRTLYNAYNLFICMAAAAADTYGIQVGTGSTALTIDDYKIETLIAHGAGGGQLQYGAMTSAEAASDASTSQITLTRDFANASGAGITVNEIGLAIQSRDVAAENRLFLLIRDTIAGGILVPNGQTLTVNYRLQAVV